MTSSLRNSLHRRNHKERSQLTHRAKYGILEKHKDYVLRARDYHAKQDRIQRLKQKAADRNKDEFYFAMKNERTVEGVHVHDRKSAAMPMDMVKLLKSQDEGYIRTIRAVGLKKIEKIKRQLTDLADLVSSERVVEDSEDDEPLADDELETLHVAGVIARDTLGKQKFGHTPPKHIVFVEDIAEVQQRLEQNTSAKKSESKGSSTVLSGGSELGWKDQESVKTKRRRRKQSIIDKIEDQPEDKQEVSNIKYRKQLLRELAARLTRETQLSYALRELEMQRLLAGKGGRKKVRGVELVEEDRDTSENEDDSPRKPKSNPSTYKPRVYKWRVERKR